MLNRIQVTTVFVSDQDAAIKFYTETLGMELKMDMPMGDFRWVEVAPENGETSIALTKPFPGMSAGNPTGMIFDTSDIAALHTELSGKGVKFTQEPKQEMWGTQAEFEDPDGNGFMVAQRAEF